MSPSDGRSDRLDRRGERRAHMGAYLTGHGGDEREVARAVSGSIRVVALAGVEKVQPVQPRARRADGVSRERRNRRNRTLVRNAVRRGMRGTQLVERVRELVRLRLLSGADPQRAETGRAREDAGIPEGDDL